MKIRLTSIFVDNQEKALKFYTEKLGFVKKTEIPVGEYNWLTVVSPDEPNGVELALEPLAFPPSIVYQKALFDAGIPATAFQVDDLEAEYLRLMAAGVSFSMGPTVMGTLRLAVLQDTVGNNIQVFEVV